MKVDVTLNVKEDERLKELIDKYGVEKVQKVLAEYLRELIENEFADFGSSDIELTDKDYDVMLDDFEEDTLS